VASVRKLAEHYSRSPERISEEDVRRYFLYLNDERKLARGSITIARCGIKFFYQKTLQQEWSVFDIARPPREARLPVVLSRDEVQQILSGVRIAVYRVCLVTIYTCGLRLREGTRLQPGDIDSERKVVHIRGKGRRDRIVPIPGRTLTLKQKWVVHVKYAGTGSTLIEYLSRYLFRPPISDRAIAHVEAGRVTFRYRDGRSKKLRCTTVSADEFIRRFLQHVLPRGFTRVRHYGCFSPGSARKRALARSLLERLEGTAPPNETSPPPIDRGGNERGIGPTDENPQAAAKSSDRPCPFCKTGTMQRVGVIARVPGGRCAQRAPP
jgi:integrase